jgi:predicted esterase
VGVLSVADLDTSTARAGISDTIGPAACDVAVHRLVHASRGVRGEPVTLSAALLVPQGARCPGPHPIVAYARGTEQDRDRTLASLADRETGLLAATFATRGFVVVATDYLGYAASDHPYHPYLDPVTEAAAVLDSIRAAREAAARLGVADNGQVFLAGYSQGGHATMAAHRALERDAPADIALVASAPMAGPYDLAATLQAQAGSLPGWLEAAFRDAIAPNDGPALPGDQALPDGLIPVAEPIVAGPATRIVFAIANGGVEPVRLDDRQGLLGSLLVLRQALVANSVSDWAPRAPMLMCHGSRDPVVPFADAQLTHAGFVARGATQVRLVDVEARPALSEALPPVGATGAALAGYHQRTVPPLCFAIVRDELFEPLRR